MKKTVLVFSCCLEACEHMDVPGQLERPAGTSPCFTSDKESDGSEDSAMETASLVKY